MRYVCCQDGDQSALRLHSAYIDWCFKLPHLRKADKSGAVEDTGTSAPPNARFFVPDIEVLEHLDLRESKAPLPDDGKLCSDFKADEVRPKVPPECSLLLVILVEGSLDLLDLASFESVSIYDVSMQALGRMSDGKVIQLSSCKFFISTWHHTAPA